MFSPPVCQKKHHLAEDFFNVYVYVAVSFTSWFHGKISGPEAVSKLQPSEDGLFLVRESIRHPGDYVLCVSVSGEVIHYRVIYRDNKLTIDNAQYFYNLIDMIEVRGSWFLVRFDQSCVILFSQDKIPESLSCRGEKRSTCTFFTQNSD